MRPIEMRAPTREELMKVIHSLPWCLLTIYRSGAEWCAVCQTWSNAVGRAKA